MARRAFISRHIVLSEENKPVFGAILIEGETISEVRKFDKLKKIENALQELQDWDPKVYEDAYIFPGIVDCNAKTNGDWEGRSFLTQAAVSGGITTVVIEPSLWQQPEPQTENYCDYGEVGLINGDSVSIDGVLAIKGYLYKPTRYVEEIQNLEGLLSEAAKSDMPVIIDPSLPNPRMLFMASPCRALSLQRRSEIDDLSDMQHFAGAFPENVIDSGENSPVEAEVENDSGLEKRLSLRDIKKSEIVRTQNHRISLISDANIVEHNDGENKLVSIRKKYHRKNLSDIYQDLDKRIKESQDNIEHLSRAEISLYSEAGTTSGDSLNSPQLQSNFPAAHSYPDMAAIKPPPSLQERRKMRPATLNVTKQKPKEESLYVRYLANCPDCWETAGVERILRAMEGIKHRVHISSLSSARSVNLVRQFKETSKSITCDTTSYFLYFTDVDIQNGDTRFKAHPPIRSNLNCNLLWDLLKMKAIDMVSSAHSPILPMYKFLNFGDFRRALSGINSMGFALQVLWTKLRQPVLSASSLEHYIVRLSKWLSLHPAKFFKIDSFKGSISPGKHADLVIWKPHETVIAKSYSKFPDMCVFRGKELYGKIEEVYVRGQLAFQGNNFYPVGRKIVR
ncbi:unnamed protein product [Blepharisma stoltei]|uniref:Amidohydrolase-related domain-containing protein n=1 Tax=Blepharisma stoltei TaxID=1481888 RepID=A0AAU9KP14_9CILI|nr:unnamed protein product [Blepharisma stoltei]